MEINLNNLWMLLLRGSSHDNLSMPNEQKNQKNMASTFYQITVILIESSITLKKTPKTSIGGERERHFVSVTERTLEYTVTFSNSNIYAYVRMYLKHQIKTLQKMLYSTNFIMNV